MKLILGMVVGLSPGEFVLDGDPTPSPKRGRAPSPIWRVVVENFEIGPKVPPAEVGGTSSYSSPVAGVPCSNAVNIGEHKTSTYSDFCTRKILSGGKSLWKCIYSVQAQAMAKHRAKFNWPPMSYVAAVTKSRRETRW